MSANNRDSQMCHVYLSPLLISRVNDSLAGVISSSLVVLVTRSYRTLIKHSIRHNNDTYIVSTTGNRYSMIHNDTYMHLQEEWWVDGTMTKLYAQWKAEPGRKSARERNMEHE